MMVCRVIQVVNHTGQTGRLTATGRSCDQKQTARPHDQVTNDHRKTKLLERQEFVRNSPQYHADVAALLENSDAEPSLITEGKPKVGPSDLLQFLLVSFRTNTFHQPDGIFRCQSLGFQANQMSAHA